MVEGHRHGSNQNRAQTVEADQAVTDACCGENTERQQLGKTAHNNGRRPAEGTFMSAATGLIEEIQRDNRFKATCPACMEDFALSDAVLFAVGTEPPAAALAALNSIRARIKERGQALQDSRERMTKGRGEPPRPSTSA
jgi:hypothetical protein